MKCHYCHKYGHIERNCWEKLRQQANSVEYKEENNFFLTCLNSSESINDVWFLDSGCNDHMICSKEMFQSMNDSVKPQVRLGNDKQVNVEDKGTIMVKTKSGKEKGIYEFYYIPGLAHNLFKCWTIGLERVLYIFSW